MPICLHYPLLLYEYFLPPFINCVCVCVLFLVLRKIILKFHAADDKMERMGNESISLSPSFFFVRLMEYKPSKNVRGKIYRDFSTVCGKL